MPSKEKILIQYYYLFITGNREDRGIAAWQVSKGTEDSIVLDPELYDEGYEVYLPLLPKRLLKQKFMKYVPFMPYQKPYKGKEEHYYDDSKNTFS